MKQQKLSGKALDLKRRNAAPAPPSATMRFVDEHAASEILGLSLGTLRNWRWRGYGPAHYKFEASVRYEIGELEEYARARRRTSTSAAA